MSCPASRRTMIARTYKHLPDSPCQVPGPTNTYLTPRTGHQDYDTKYFSPETRVEGTAGGPKTPRTVPGPGSRGSTTHDSNGVLDLRDPPEVPVLTRDGTRIEGRSDTDSERGVGWFRTPFSVPPRDPTFTEDLRVPRPFTPDRPPISSRRWDCPTSSGPGTGSKKKTQIQGRGGCPHRESYTVSPRIPSDLLPPTTSRRSGPTRRWGVPGPGSGGRVTAEVPTCVR